MPVVIFFARLDLE